jgi:biotin transport system substrate-specific component
MSNIRINLWPVPITMQTFGVILIAFFFGSRKGMLTIMLYLLAGIVGLGVFTGYQSGFGAFFGPTGGYLLGFLACVFFVGLMIENGYGRNWKSVVGVMAVGNLIIYTFGLIGLFFYLGGTGAVGFDELLMQGIVPFLVGDLIKIIGASALVPFLWKNRF